MRVSFLTAMMFAAVMASACAVRAEIPNTPEPAAAFAAVRGQALPPPAPSGAAQAGQTAPPEGVGPGGIDFGQWRAADPDAYGPAFQTQMRQRLAGKSREFVSADLAANGFACSERGDALECRIEIMERECAHDWYVALDAQHAEPIAGYDVMCLGAR